MSIFTREIANVHKLPKYYVKDGKVYLTRTNEKVKRKKVKNDKNTNRNIKFSIKFSF